MMADVTVAVAYPFYSSVPSSIRSGERKRARKAKEGTETLP